METKFNNLLRPLDPEEYKRLETSIKEEGLRDALVVWKEEDILLDGHNRYTICNDWGETLKFEYISLENESAARMWIINNQLGRRNLTPNELSYFRGLRYKEEKKEPHGRTDRDFSGNQNDYPKTVDKLADEFGVSAPTIQRDEKFAEALDIVTEKEGEDFKHKVFKGEVTKKEVLEMADPNPIIPKSTGNEWWTPKEYIASVKNVLGTIDLDPASCDEANETIGAVAIYTKETNGVEQPWYGKVFMNPPYSENKSFAQKMSMCWDSGDIEEAIILLGAHAIETKWFSWYWDHTLCFTGHRISFDTPSGKKKAGNIAGSVFIYLGKYPREFAREFEQHGYVVRRWPDA